MYGCNDEPGGTDDGNHTIIICVLLLSNVLKDTRVGSGCAIVHGCQRIVGSVYSRIQSQRMSYMNMFLTIVHNKIASISVK